MPDTRVRDPENKSKAVLKALKRIGRGQEEDEFEVSIARLTEVANELYGDTMSKTSVYRLAEKLAESGEITMSHDGPRRNPFKFKLNGDTPAAQPSEDEEFKEIALNWEQKLGNIVAQQKMIKDENARLRAENESLKNELQMYRTSLRRVDHLLQEAV